MQPGAQATIEWIPIGISGVSLIVAGIALGWNIYRDVILKARVRVDFAIVTMVTPGEPTQNPPRFLRLSATNHGPGTVTIRMITGRVAPLWRRLLRKVEHFIILNDHTNPLNPALPVRLEVGETISLLLPYDERCFLKGQATHIGVSDSFDRAHFAPRKRLRTARAQFQDDFADELDTGG